MKIRIRKIPKPPKGMVRMVYKFLLLPKAIKDGDVIDIRWLQWAAYKRRYDGEKWVDIKWLDDNNWMERVRRNWVLKKG